MDAIITNIPPTSTQSPQRVSLQGQTGRLPVSCFFKVQQPILPVWQCGSQRGNVQKNSIVLVAV